MLYKVKIRGQIVNLVIKNLLIGTDTGTVHWAFSLPGQYCHGCRWGLFRLVSR